MGMTDLTEALDEIERAAAANVERSLILLERIRDIRRQLDDGAPITTVIEAEPAPRTVQLISINMATLETVGADYRASLAQALRAEGLSTVRIGEIFGVSRQRISALLRQHAGTTSDH